jgi:adenylosuccinate lyase
MTVAERFLERVEIVGKFSGAVGTFASLGTRAVQASIMSQLGLAAAPISTQVVSRLHYADFVFALSALAAALERLGKEVRNLQRSEINELSEGFGEKQVGSSTMPQKRNPHKSERVCGLARVVRAQLDPTLETVSLEHERDLTNSSAERITLPTAACLTHYILTEMAGVLRALHVDGAAVARNLRAGGGRQCAERVMLALAGKLGRQEAHEILKAHAAADDFVAALKGDARVAGALTPAEIDALLDPEGYTGLAAQVTDAVVASHGARAAR